MSTATATVTAAVPTERRDEIIAAAIREIIQGESLRDVAARHGIANTTLHAWLLGEVPEQYRAIQREGLIARIVSADEELDNAKDHVSISRTREKAKFVRWDAERRLKSLFGPSQEIGAPGQFAQLDNLERARRAQFVRTIADEPIDAEYSHVAPTTGVSS